MLKCYIVCYNLCLIDVLLESQAVNSTNLEELKKKIDEIVQELSVLKEVQALHYGTENIFLLAAWCTKAVI